MFFAAIILNARNAVELDKFIALQFAILVVVVNEEAFYIFVVKYWGILASQDRQEVIQFLFKHNFPFRLLGIWHRVLIEDFSEDKNCSFVYVSFLFIEQWHSALLVGVEILNNHFLGDIRTQNFLDSWAMLGKFDFLFFPEALLVKFQPHWMGWPHNLDYSAIWLSLHWEIKAYELF